MAALTSFIQGSQWSTKAWYGQILGADSELQSHDVNLSAAFQQYRKILGLNLMVTTPLSRTQDTTTKDWEVTGTAVVSNFVRPNKGDTFIATIDSGRTAIFTVTSSEMATYMQGSSYIINYQLTNYADPTLVNDLDEKSVQTFQYVQSLLDTGQYPLLTTDSYAKYTGLGAIYSNLLSLYFRDFFSVEYQTLLVPDQGDGQSTYDPWATRAFVNLVSTEENLRLPKIRMPTVRGDLAMVNVSMWDALMEVNSTYLATGIQRAGLVDAMSFKNFPNLTGIYYTGVQNVVYPRDARTDIDAQYSDVWDLPISKYLPGNLRYRSLARNLRAAEQAFFETTCQCVETEDGTSILPAIVPVTTDDYYVFTSGFYGVNGHAMASQLELMVHGVINGQAPDRTKLLEMANAAFGWPNLERYYYIPTILMMIKISLGSST